MDAIPATTPPAGRDVGGTLLSLLLQALTWAAFGAFFAFGWHVGDWLWARA